MIGLNLRAPGACRSCVTATLVSALWYAQTIGAQQILLAHAETDTTAHSIAIQTAAPEASVDLPALSEAEQGDLPISSAYVTQPLPDAAVPVVEPSNPSVEARGGEAISSSPRRFQYAFRLTVRGVHDDNINLDRLNPVGDFYFSIEPTVVLALGDAAGRQENFIRFDYRPRAFFFVEHSNNNAIQHLARLEGQYRISRLKIHGSQEVQLLDGSEVDIRSDTGVISNRVNLDVSGRTELRLFTSQLDASYDVSGKSFLTGGLSYVVSDYESLISSEVLQGNIGFNYNYSPKLVVSVGGGGGINKVDSGNPDQTFQNVNGRISYSAGGKLNFHASGGVEFRQFEGEGRGQYVSPTFDIGANYQPFDGTTLSLRASRSTQNSAVLEGQDFASTSIYVSARQRFMRRFTFSMGAGYENAEYFATRAGLIASRNDDYFFVQPSVDVTLTRFWTVGAFYLRRQSESSIPQFGFKGNQVGVQSTLTF